MKFYLNGKELKDCLVTQNRYGVYYADKDDKGNIKSYWRTTIAKFDTATPPSPYKKYTGGSHASYLSQMAYDFYGEQFWKITCDKDVVITKHYGASAGYGCSFTCEGKTFTCAHTADHPAVGTTVKAGQMITQVGKYSKIAVHLHMYCSGTDLKEIILGTTNMNNMKYEKNTNLRKGNGTSYDVEGKIIAGAVGKVIDGPRTADGYTWYNLAFGKDSTYRTGWAIEGAFTNEAVTNLDATPIETPPVTPPDCSECEKRVKELQGQVGKLQSDLEASEGRVKELEKELENAEDVNDVSTDRLNAIIHKRMSEELEKL